MSDDAVAVEVYILDKTYRIACAPEEREALLASARLLNDKMREIRGSGKVISADRLAIMAGLNIAHELLRQESAGPVSAPPKHLQRRIVALSNKVAEALNIEA